METYTFEDIKNEVYGAKGTPRRDKIEKELASLQVGLQIRNARKENDGQNLTLATLYDIVSKGLGMSFKVEIL